MSSTSSTKDAALAAVGRTVVNFQRLEHNLKIAARYGPLDGVITKVQKDIERRVEKSLTLTLGQAIQVWLAAIGGESHKTTPTPDLFDPTIRMTFSLNRDSESVASHFESLARLLEVRNNLIHGGLVTFDWDSPNACARLIDDLKPVNDDIGSQIDFLAAVIASVQDIQWEDVHLDEE
jgi:hypothetical protein